VSFGGDTEPGEIDLSCPINWDHPDNSGLALCLSAVDGTAGGAKFLNLCRPGDPTAGGTLVNGPTWVGTPWGQWEINATSAGYVLVTHSGALAFQGTLPFSCAITYTVASATAFSRIVAVANATDGWSMQFGADGVAPVAQRSAASSYQKCTGSAMTVGTPQRLAMAYDGTSIRMYQNGVQTAIASSPNLSQTLSTSQLGVFAFAGGGNRGAGKAGDMRVWSLSLSAAQIKADYQWSRDPATDPRLNRITGRTYFLPPYTATTRKTGYAPWIPGLGW